MQRARLGDVEVLRDLAQRSSSPLRARAITSARNSAGNALGRGVDPSSKERILTGQESTEPGAVPFWPRMAIPPPHSQLPAVTLGCTVLGFAGAVGVCRCDGVPLTPASELDGRSTPALR